MLSIRERLEHGGERVDVQGFGEMRVEAGGAGALDVVGAAEAGDGNHGDVFAAGDPA